MRSIDADELMKLYENPPGLNIDNFSVPISVIRQNIQDMPTIESAEVVHGEWKCSYDEDKGETNVTCSQCKYTRTINGCYVTTEGDSCYFEDNYCPNCGVKMDLMQK